MSRLAAFAGTRLLTLQHHPLLYALLEPAVLAPVPLRLRDLAVAVRHARVHPPVLHRPLEEALAALAGDDAVVQARRLVLADHADHRLLLLLRRLLRGQEPPLSDAFLFNSYFQTADDCCC